MYGIAEILQEMPTIGNLLRVWKSLTDRMSIRPGPVTTDHLDMRMPGQPSDNGRHTSVWQHIDHSVMSEVTDPCAVPISTPIGPIVDADHMNLLRRNRFWNVRLSNAL